VLLLLPYLQDVNQLSIEELEAELARRKGNAGGNSKPPSA
jgi:hypothetical protein